MMASFRPWEVTNSELLAILIHNRRCEECCKSAIELDREAVEEVLDYSNKEFMDVVSKTRGKYTDMLGDEELIRIIMATDPLLLPLIWLRSLGRPDDGISIHAATAIPQLGERKIG
jgi:hypothetical protein